MKIKWKNIYYPVGNWVDKNGNVFKKAGNFRAKYKNNEILVVHTKIESKGGHGEGIISGFQPTFFDSETLKQIHIYKDEYIEI